MPDFNEIIKEILKEIESLTEETFKMHKDEAFKDGRAFLDKIEDDLERLSNLVIKGELTAEEFEWLVRSKKDLAEMVLLKQAGLTMIKIDQFKNRLLDLVVGHLLTRLGL